MAKLIGIARAPKIMAPLEEINETVISKESGIDGDARGRKRGRQITILFEDDWLDACNDINENLPWTTRRANLLVRGMRGPQKEGNIIKIGKVQLKICSETDPCDVMENTKPGLRKALEPLWRGGVSCEVKQGGDISIGDEVEISDN